MPLDLPVIVTGCGATQIPFIFHSWIRVLQMESQYKRLDKNWFNCSQHALIENLIQSPTSHCLIAAYENDPDTILGYIVGWPTERVLHFIYVKEKFRKLGIATRLMEEMFTAPERSVEVTETTRDLPKLQRWRLIARTYRLCEATRTKSGSPVESPRYDSPARSIRLDDSSPWTPPIPSK
jgi:GNAT superfamily N-acetyltransferase